MGAPTGVHLPATWRGQDARVPTQLSHSRAPGCKPGHPAWKEMGKCGHLEGVAPLLPYLPSRRGERIKMLEVQPVLSWLDDKCLLWLRVQCRGCPGRVSSTPWRPCPHQGVSTELFHLSLHTQSGACPSAAGHAPRPREASPLCPRAYHMLTHVPEPSRLLGGESISTTTCKEGSQANTRRARQGAPFSHRQGPSLTGTENQHGPRLADIISQDSPWPPRVTVTVRVLSSPHSLNSQQTTEDQGLYRCELSQAQ